MLHGWPTLPAGGNASLILAGVCACLLLPQASRAQSAFFLRVAPEAARVSVEHTKKVTIGGGSSSSASSSSGVTLAATVSAGVRGELSGGWLLGGEIDGVLSARQVIDGPIHPTPNGNVHDVWPGSWSASDRHGAGGSLLLGRRVGDGGATVYLIGGARRMWTEFSTRAVNPATGAAGEAREQHATTPWTVGAGATLPWKWPVDVRVRYSRSHLDWVVSGESATLDYRYDTSGWFVSVGMGILG